MVVSPLLKDAQYEYQGICLIALVIIGHHPVITLYNPFRGIFKLAPMMSYTCGSPFMLLAYLREQDVDTKKKTVNWTKIKLRMPGYIRYKGAYSLRRDPCTLPYPLVPWDNNPTYTYHGNEEYDKYPTYDMNAIIKYMGNLNRFETLNVVNENMSDVWNKRYWSCKQVTTYSDTGWAYRANGYDGKGFNMHSFGYDCNYSGSVLDQFYYRDDIINPMYLNYYQLFQQPNPMKFDIVESKGIKYIRNYTGTNATVFSTILYNFNVRLYEQEHKR